MPIKETENTLSHIANLTNPEPSIFDLLLVRDLWRQIEKYWQTFNNEIERRHGPFQIVRMLDFDIIYPAFWHAETQSQKLLEERMGFPVTTNFVLNYTNSLFTIPTGAYFELVYHIDKLKQFLKIRSKRFTSLMDDLRSLQSKADWEDAASGRSEGITDLVNRKTVEIESEIDQLIDAKERLHGLTEILNHEYYRSWNEITQQANVILNPKEVVEVWNIIQARRNYPDKDLNNYFDALNVASYNALAQKVRHSQTESNYFPLFATSTKAVLNLPKAETEHDQPSLLNEIAPIVSIQYLSFATALELYAENNMETLTAVGETGLQEIQNLQRIWSRLWNEIKSKYEPPRTGDHDGFFKSVKLSDLSSLTYFNQFCESYSVWKNSFDQTVGNIFFNVTQADRQLSENNNSVKRQLLKERSGQSFEEFKILTSGLSERFDWTRSAASVDSELLFQHYTRNLSGSELTLNILRKENILKEHSQIFSEPVSTYRTRVILADIKQSLFYWERTVGCKTQLCCWEYGLNLERALENIGRFLMIVNNEKKFKRAVNLRLYAEDFFDESYIEPQVESKNWFNIILKINPTPSYLRFSTDACTVFMDVTPVESGSSLELAVMYKEKSLHSAVANLQRSTSSTPLSAELIEALLQEYDNNFASVESRDRVFRRQSKRRNSNNETGLEMV